MFTWKVYQGTNPAPVGRVEADDGQEAGYKVKLAYNSNSYGVGGIEGISAELKSANGTVYKWDGQRWAHIGGAGCRVVCDPTGAPWLVNKDWQVFRYTGHGNWAQAGVGFRDIGAGADGSIFAVSSAKDDMDFNGAIYQWNPGTGSFASFGGAGHMITVDDQGNPIIVNLRGEIWRHTGAGFSQLPTPANNARARDIGFNAGTLWLTSNDYLDGDSHVFKWNGTGGMLPGPGAAQRIAAGAQGFPWLVNVKREVWEVNAAGAVKRRDGCLDVGISCRGEVFIVAV
jgi:hypothetical protein